MNVTFLVELNLDTLADLVGTSSDIEDALSTSFDVKSVKPWARPSITPQVNPLQSLPPLLEPQPNQQTKPNTQ